MLFNSLSFLIFFFPVVMVGFYGLRKIRCYFCGKAWLLLSSLFFYAWWDYRYLVLLIGSIGFNWIVAKCLLSNRQQRWVICTTGIIFNLSVLAYYKYADFFITNISNLIPFEIQIAQIVLPLGISFFTFQQIAFLVDVYKEKIKSFDFLSYGLFVAFFPQLIAGPIVHFAQMMPQFKDDFIKKTKQTLFTASVLLFIFGLFKKVMLADHLALYATPVFNNALTQSISLIDAVGATLAYSGQLYFDFSGYCDMALGLAGMLGIKLPLNFNSPYQAVNIIDFWRRWHITLSHFLRDYVYIPLGGSRGRWSLRYQNILLTMAIGGLWHGAGWNFILWGLLHGLLICLNHAWRALAQKYSLKELPDWFCVAITFTLVALAWVLFRAENMTAVSHIYQALFGLSEQTTSVFNTLNSWLMVVFSLGIAFMLPNAYHYTNALSAKLSQDQITTSARLNFILGIPVWLHALMVSVLLIVSLLLMQTNVAQEFLYYDF